MSERIPVIFTKIIRSNVLLPSRLSNGAYYCVSGVQNRGVGKSLTDWIFSRRLALVARANSFR